MQELPSANSDQLQLGFPGLSSRSFRFHLGTADAGAPRCGDQHQEPYADYVPQDVLSVYRSSQYTTSPEPITPRPNNPSTGLFNRTNQSVQPITAR